MRRALAVSSLLCWCGAAGWGRPALATGGAATDAYEGIAPTGLDVHGLLDLYAIHNFNNPASGLNQLREFDYRDQPSLEYVRLTLAARPRPIGFRLDAGVGNTADVFEQEDPALARHPSYARATSFLGQAFVTATLPFVRPVEVDVGKFGTPVGLEDNEALSNWNYSRSLLFAWAEPTLHTGLRLTSELSKAVAVSLFWVNGWNAGVLDGSGMRTFAGAVTWRLTDGVELTVVDMAGPERPPTELTGPLSFRNILDVFAVLEPWNGVTFALITDVATDRARGGVYWWGAGWYARVQSARSFAATLRGDVLFDPDGFVTGTPQTVTSLTATAEAHGNVGRLRLVTRLEYRHDQSNADAFDAALPASRNDQSTVTLAFLGAF